MTEHHKTYYAHLANFQKTAQGKGLDAYRKMYRESVDSPETFWSRQAEHYLTWEKKWDSVLRYDFNEAQIQWFGGGRLNASFNCLDRHLETHGEKVAYYW